MRGPRNESLALVGVLLVLGALACLISPLVTTSPARKLRFMIWGTPEEVRVVQGFLEDFRAAHPGVSVEVEHAPSFGYADKLRIQFLGGNPPDVMYVSQEYVEDFARAGHLLDLNALEARDRAELSPDDFYPEVYERFRHQGRLYGISKDFATLVVYYNRDLFQKWDVPYPQPGWTWDDFLGTAKQLSREGDYGFLVETWSEELFPWVWQAGGEVAQDDPPEWLMGKPEHIEQSAQGLQFLRDLIWEHKVAPGPSVTRDQGGNALFVRGKVAMCTYGRWACMDFAQVDRFDWDVVELPRQARPATSTFAVAYSIAAQSQRQEEAWTLVKFLTSKEQQVKVAHSVQAIPARRSVAEGPAFLHPSGLEHLGYPIQAAPHTAGVTYGRFSPRFRGANEAKQIFTQAAEGLWGGSQTDARALLARIQPEIEAVLTRSAR